MCQCTNPWDDAIPTAIFSTTKNSAEQAVIVTATNTLAEDVENASTLVVQCIHALAHDNAQNKYNTATLCEEGMAVQQGVRRGTRKETLLHKVCVRAAVRSVESPNQFEFP